MKDRLDNLVSEGVLSRQDHPVAPLAIYNYTARCQHDRLWDDCTMQARGLILDRDGGVVSRGFNKFFNYSEYKQQDAKWEPPNEPFRVYDKLDGSLGILYFIDDAPWIATRGSFESPQAEWATNHFRGKYRGYRPPDGFTAVFEIIYPDNRIVVDYGETCGLFHIGLVDNATGLPRLELDANWAGPQTATFPPLPPEQLSKEVRPNAEGFVLRYTSGFQAKIKLEEYVRLHRIIFQTSSRSIWENLMAGASPELLIDSSHQEVAWFVQKWVSGLTADYLLIERNARCAFDSMPRYKERKNFALNVIISPYKSILFAMLDGKDYSKTIWKMIEPQWVPARTTVGDEE